MRRAIFFGFIVLACLSNCKKDTTTNSTCNSCPAISFNKDVIPLFAQKCSISGCHTGQFPKGNISLDSAVAYTASLKPGTGYVSAGSPSTSIMVNELFAGAILHMPPGGQLSACEIDTISCWIQQGALNN